jgi:hypothetical protein
MQEILIKPKSIYKHPLQLDQPSELVYSFNTRKNNIRFGLLSSTQHIIPIHHVPSAKTTLHGSLLLQPGLYHLIFDNSYSLNTPKLLYYSVSIHAPQANTFIEYQGWLLKKGNFNGYFKRWVVIDSSGVLTYFRLPGTVCRGYANLKSAAVRLDQDRHLIDIDSGQHLFHFKVTDPQDFQKWSQCIQNYADSSSVSVSLHGITSRLSLHDSQKLSLKASMDMDMNNQEMHNYFKKMLEALQQESSQMKQLIHASKGRIDSKSSWKGLF